MAKTKRKNHNEKRHYEGIIREQDKEIIRLKRQLRYFEKREHWNTLPEPEIQTAPILVTEMKVPCLECNKGFYDEMVIIDKVYGRCETCGHNKRLK